MDIYTDILIVGCGVSGMYSALNIDKNYSITIISKSKTEECNTYLAQGGISCARGIDDIDLFVNDTMKAGKNKNNIEAVKVLSKESIENIHRLMEFGMDFDYKDGELDYTREGAHSINRIVHSTDETGKRVFETLLDQVKKRDNITIYEDTILVDILKFKGECCGGIVKRDDKVDFIHAKYVILASGGIGGLFSNSTNRRTITGDGIAIALKNNIEVGNLEYVQFHPTALYEEDNLEERKFLISESLRGEGAKLFNINRQRFINELLPRDVVAASIWDEEKKTNSKFVYLDASFMKSEFIINRFPGIYKECKKRGIDVTCEPIPVTPVQHYFMGGIKVDLNSKTSMNNLYACGEVSCTGVHGANRLASNSLLEGLVFSRRAALDINKFISGKNVIDVNRDISIEEVNKLIDSNLDCVLNEFKKVLGEKNMNSLTIDSIITNALKEDGAYDDITTNSIVNVRNSCKVQLIAKEDGVLCGIDTFTRVFEILGDTTVKFFAIDGEKIKNGQVIGEIRGLTSSVLSGERVALNILQRMSGVATLTSKFVEKLQGTKAKLLDTRKTTPNFRILERYAVKIGGGENHRYNLSDGVLIKDNHIDAAGGIKNAIDMVRKNVSFVKKIEVETESLEQVKEALSAKADIIMLDNMKLDTIMEALSIIDGRALTEVSGNVELETIRPLAETGVDYISTGYITHSYKVLDLSMKNLILI